MPRTRRPAASETPTDTPREPIDAVAVLPDDELTSPEQAKTDYIAHFTGSQVAPERKAVIFNCADHLKMSPGEIAERLSMDRRTVKAVLANRDASALEARNLLAANSLQFAQDWLDASKIGAGKGKHGPAKDALLHLKVIEPIQDNQTNVQVAIVVGAPGQPLGLAPPQVPQNQSDTD